MGRLTATDLLVQFAPDISPARIEAAAAAIGGRVLDTIDTLGRDIAEEGSLVRMRIGAAEIRAAPEIGSPARIGAAFVGVYERTRALAYNFSASGLLIRQQRRHVDVDHLAASDARIEHLPDGIQRQR